MDILSSIPHADRLPALVSMALIRERYHSGNGFSASHKFGSVPSGGSADVLLQTPRNGDIPHITRYAFSPDVSAERVRLFEGTKPLNVGPDPDALADLNRREDNAPSMKVTVNPKVGTLGTELEGVGVPNGQGIFSDNASVEVEGIDWTLAADTNYLLRFENVADNAADEVFFSMNWYRILSSEVK